MSFIVDTSVWSLALRKSSLKPSDELAVQKLRKLIEYGEHIFLLGIILQEVLQGIKNHDQFVKVQKELSYYEVLKTDREDHVYAAGIFNTCRSKGVTASTVDFLIASVAIRNDCRLLTTDKDFGHIAKHSELQII